MYIKKTQPKSVVQTNTRVKMICDWQSPDKLVNEWSIMPVPSNIELVHEYTDIDYYVIINKPGNGTFKPEKTILYQMEPTIYDENKPWGAKTWPKVNSSKYYRIQNHQYLNGVQWNFKVLDIPEKNDDIVSILSGYNWDTGHILRTDFVKANQDLIQVFGKINFHSVVSYKGPVPDENRFNVYSGVKYCIACENNSEINYATEKIWEPILCEVLAFYWGCPNLEDYIDSRAFVRLPLEDPVKARAIIDQAIAEDWWSQRINVIREEKKKILNIYGFFPNLQRAVTRTKAVIITLKDANDRSEMIQKLTKNLAKLGIDTEIFYGINGKNIVTDGDKLTYGDETYTYDPSVRLSGQRMTPGEFGCAWSHMTVYKQLRDDPKYNNYLIFEDDAEMCGDLFALNDAIVNLPKNYDMCHIAMTDWHPFVHTDAVNNIYYNVQRKFFNRLTAYFVSKAGANKLIRDSLSLPADDLLSNMFVNGKIDVCAPKQYVFQQTKDIISTIKTVDSL
jgi:GR25 family glycosyltransferase involved in LPS biosynthesis